MKTIFTFLIVIGLVTQGYSQTNTSYQNQLDLIKKSDSQYTGGWIFLGTGTALVLTSWTLPNTYDSSDGSSNQKLISFLGWTGALAIITSVPLFLSAGQNARMAARLSLQNQTLYQPISIPGQPKSFPSLSLKIPL